MKRIMKKMIVVLMFLITLYIQCDNLEAASYVAQGTCPDGMAWTLDSEGTLSINGTGKMTGYEVQREPMSGSYIPLNCPWEEYCDNVYKVVFGEGIIAFEDNAFWLCKNIKSIVMPSTMIYDGSAVLNELPKLEEFIVSSNNERLSSVDGVLFNKEKTVLIKYPVNKKTTSYSIPNGVTKIEIEAFKNCVNLVNVVVPDTVTEIGSSAFVNCSKLSSFSYPYKMKEADLYNFDGCIALEKIVLPSRLENISGYSPDGLKAYEIDEENRYFSTKDGILFDKKQQILYSYPEGKVASSYTVPNTVTNIACYAFASNTTLTKLVLTESVIEISLRAFSNCINLEEVVFSESLKKIDEYAFFDCKKLKNIELKEGLEELERGAFCRCVNLEKIIFPASVKKIGEEAFASCDMLDNIEVLSDDIDIGGNAFAYTAWMKKQGEYVVLGDALICYQGSESEVIIPEGVKQIGQRAFAFNNNIKSVVIPATVKRIKEFAFDGSTIENIENATGIEMVAKNAFRFTPWEENQGDFLIINGCLFCCNGLSGDVVIPEGVTIIGEAAFENLSGLISIKKITIPASVERIEKYAFAFCGIREIVFSEGLKSIGEYAFGQNRITTLLLPDSLEVLEDHAFGQLIADESIEKYKGIQEFRISKGVKQIGDMTTQTWIQNFVVDEGNALFSSKDGVLFNKDQTKLICFPKKKSTNGYVIPNTVTTIGTRAFYNCSPLPAIPSSVTTIETLAFERSHHTSEPLILPNVKKVEAYAFKSTNIWDVVIENTIEECEEDAFGDSLICRVQFEDKVTEITDYMFANCKWLTKVTMSTNLKTIGKGAFYQCDTLKEILVEEGVALIEDEAFGTKTTNSGTATASSNTASMGVSVGVSAVMANAKKDKRITVLNRKCKIEDSPNTFDPAAIIVGYKNSTAHAYAKKYGRKFETVKLISITRQPTSQTGKVGQKIRLKVNATPLRNTDTLKFQWQVYNKKTKKWKNANYTGSKTAAMTVKIEKGKDGQKYRCVIKTKDGKKVTSDTVMTAVAIKITKNPKKATVKKNKKVKLTVKATGYKVKYQWQVYNRKAVKWDNLTLKGNKKATMTVKVTKKMKVRCLITDGTGNQKASKAVRLKLK